jgi:hypothetical protein
MTCVPEVHFRILLCRVRALGAYITLRDNWYSCRSTILPKPELDKTYYIERATNTSNLYTTCIRTWYQLVVEVLLLAIVTQHKECFCQDLLHGHTGTCMPDRLVQATQCRIRMSKDSLQVRLGLHSTQFLLSHRI